MTNDSAPPQNRQVKCPQCKKLTSYAPENLTRPFCSVRCRQIDLGAWADETYRIPVAPSLEDSLDSDLAAELEEEV